jgi:hypothetical protein
VVEEVIMGSARSVLLRRRILAAVAGTMLLVVAGCGSSGSSSGPVSTATTTTVAPVLTAGQLTDALLTISELPPGWSKTSSSSDSSGSSSFLCPAGVTAERTEIHPTADAMFQQSDMGPMLLQELSSAPDADAHFADVKRVFESCAGQSWLEDFGGSSVPVTMVEVSGASAGERSITYRNSGTDAASTVTLTIDFTIVGRSTAIEMYAAVNVSSPVLTIAQLSPADFASIVAKGDAKVVRTLATTATNDTATS